MLCLETVKLLQTGVAFEGLGRVLNVALGSVCCV